jgi:hypothetical protein
MPRPTSSAAAVLTRERSAAFVAEYALAPAVPVLSATLVVKMIDARQRFLDREVRSLDVDVELLVVSAFGCLDKRRELRDARVHEQDIDFAQLLRDLRIQPVHFAKLRDVCLHRHHAISDRSHRFIQGLLTSTRDGHSRAFFLQAFGRRQPDSGH